MKNTNVLTNIKIAPNGLVNITYNLCIKGNGILKKSKIK